jgi:hypothetical protein
MQPFIKITGVPLLSRKVLIVRSRALNISRFKLKYQHKRSLEQKLRVLSLNYRFAAVVIE